MTSQNAELSVDCQFSTGLCLICTQCMYPAHPAAKLASWLRQIIVLDTTEATQIETSSWLLSVSALSMQRQTVPVCLGPLLCVPVLWTDCLSYMCRLQISMIDGQVFDTLEALARGIRGNQDPFGGIQLILSGLYFPSLPASVFWA